MRLRDSVRQGAGLLMAKLMDPMDKRTKRFPFSYRSAAQTDVRKTIAAELRRIAEEKRKHEEIAAEAKAKVVAKIGK
jgi:hypothetical protein